MSSDLTRRNSVGPSAITIAFAQEVQDLMRIGAIADKGGNPG